MDLIHKNLKRIASVLLVTYSFLISGYSYSNPPTHQSSVNEGKALGLDLRNNLGKAEVSESGSIKWDGVEQFDYSIHRVSDGNQMGINAYGDDARTLSEGDSKLRALQESLGMENPSQEQIAFGMLNESFTSQRPDIRNETFWEYTDDTKEDFEEWNAHFADCSVVTQKVYSGKEYHVPKYKTCEKMPALEESFTLYHDYEVGVLTHHSGPVNLANCGEGCIRMWIGTALNDVLSGNCTIYEESMAVRVLQPRQIIRARHAKAIFDDYHQVWLNDNKIYNGPDHLFPPETNGACERDTSWVRNPDIDITSNFNEVPPGEVLNFKTRTSVTGYGEGYSMIELAYSPDQLVFNDLWTKEEDIQKTLTIYGQIQDGFCEGSITCTSMPVTSESCSWVNGERICEQCMVENGVRVCESDFPRDPLGSIGVSPFCKKIEVTSTCDWNETELCWENSEGDTVCFDNDTVDRNTCKQYENDPECSYVSSECMDGMEGSYSGSCYYEDWLYDCGFSANSGIEIEEEVINCDGEIRCVGDECISPSEDVPNEEFLNVAARLEVLKYAKGDMTCINLPDEPYNAVAPPDQYSQIPICLDDQEYDEGSGKCISGKSCSFDENNFYLEGERRSHQILSNGQVVLEPDQSQYCEIPIEHEGKFYLCGETMQADLDGIFREVCLVDVVEDPQGRGCPSNLHSVNPGNGLCQVPMQARCSDEALADGYTFTSNGTPFDRLGDGCYKKCDGGICQSPVEYSCPDEYPVENEDEYRCEAVIIDRLAGIGPGMTPDSGDHLPEGTIFKHRATESDLTENVSCEIFRGEAAECKVAVGGMQDCCESPAAVSLADYIALTTSIMAVDAVVVKLELIQSYPGAWEGIKTGVSMGWELIQSTEIYQTVANGVKSAWAAVKGLFTTGGDAAAAVGETINQGIMTTIQQAVMTFANTVISTIFGPQVAGLFFQPNPAGGLQMTPGMQTAMTYMTYAYYAYLAYIAFTMLVNVVYECSDEEIDLAVKKEILGAHYIGSYCKQKIPAAVGIPVCIEKRNVYCAFSSPFSRIMMEQIYKQPHMGLDWGSAENPNCQGVKLEDLDKVDWAQLDLDEWIGILIQTDSLKALTSELTVEGITGKDTIINRARGLEENAIDKMNHKLEDTDADETKQQAYLEGWNKSISNAIINNQ